MFERNEIVHSVIWPAGTEPVVALIDVDGVQQGHFWLKEPMRGSELAKQIPADWFLQFQECTLVKMTGEVVIGNKIPFDTKVVTERAELTYEQRLLAVERRDKHRAKAEKQRQAEFEAFMKEQREKAEALEAVTEPPETPTDEEPEVKAPEGEEQAQEGENVS